MSLEFISLRQEKGRYRCGFLYELKIRNCNAEKKYYIDLNHKVRLVDGKFRFKRNQKWDYEKWPIETPIIDVIPFNKNHEDIDEIISMVKEQYKKQLLNNFKC